MLFHKYDLTKPSARIDDLLAEVDRDPTGIFWGCPLPVGSDLPGARASEGRQVDRQDNAAHPGGRP
ncbi:MAG: DUF3024 domain-containing protein [Streptosporangiales bacterium]